jgi:hypothetical protein
MVSAAPRHPASAGTMASTVHPALLAADSIAATRRAEAAAPTTDIGEFPRFPAEAPMTCGSRACRK